MSEENLDNDEPMGDETDEESEAALTSEAEAEAEAEAIEGPSKRTLGIERWVQMGFMVVALLLVWLFGNLISAIWYAFADPNESIVTVASVVLGILGAIAFYRYQPAHGLANEIAEEMSKVTWPSRKETSDSTIVVIVTSIVAALMLFMFDTIWSAVTDLVYKV
jgi:preprotein translocase subunit SecE